MDFDGGAFGMFQKIPQAGVAFAAAVPSLLGIPGGAAFGKGTQGLFLSVGTFHGGFCGCVGTMADGQEVRCGGHSAGGFHRFLTAVSVRALAHGCAGRNGPGNCGGICRVWDCVVCRQDAEKENGRGIGNAPEGDAYHEDV